VVRTRTSINTQQQLATGLEIQCHRTESLSLRPLAPDKRFSQQGARDFHADRDEWFFPILFRRRSRIGFFSPARQQSNNFARRVSAPLVSKNYDFDT
jgi:hypothetical protein